MHYPSYTYFMLFTISILFFLIAELINYFWTREIRDQVYKEKENKVIITIVCCNPEKIRDKLCCKGAKVIKSIEILDPPKPEKPKPKDPEKEPEKPKPKDPEKEPKKPKPKDPEKPKLDKKVTFKDPPKDSEKPKPTPKQEQPKSPASAPAPVPIPVPAPAPTPAPAPPPPILGPGPCEYPPISPGRNCCGPCSQGYGVGPFYFGHGPPPLPMPQPCFDGYYVYGCHDRPCHVTGCDYYFSEENPHACLIM